MTTQPSVSSYLNLSSASYFSVGGSAVPPAGWSVLLSSTNTLSGMQAVAFQNTATGAIVISYEGTNIGGGMNSAQGSADLSIATGSTPQANIDALAFAKTVSLLANGNSIFVTGHSLGGEEAEYVDANTNSILGGISGGAVFGAPGVPNLNLASGSGNNFISYVDVNDPIANSGNHVGTVQYVGTEESMLLPISPLAQEIMDLQNHYLSNYAADLGYSTQIQPTAGVMDIAYSNGLSFSAALQASQYQYQANSLLSNGYILTADNNSVSLSNSSGQTAELFMGSGQSISVSAGNSLIVAGASNTVNAIDATVYLSNGVSATIAGSGNSVDISKNDTLFSNGANTINVMVNGYSFSDTLANSKVVEDAQGDATFTSNLSNGGTSSVLLAPNGSGTITADGNSFNYAAGSLNQVSSDGNGGLLVTMPAAGASGLSEALDITSSGATISSGGNAVASATSGGAVSDSGGTLTVTSAPVAGVTETVTEAPTGSFTETLQSTNTTAQANSFVMQFSSDPTTGLLAPTVVDFNSIDWSPSSSATLNTFVGQTANTINNGDATAAQTQTQSALAADTNQFLNGVLPTGLTSMSATFTPLLADTSTDGTAANTDQGYVTSSSSPDIVDPYAVTDPGAGTVGGDGTGNGDTNTGNPSSGDTGSGNGDSAGGEDDDPLVLSMNGQGISLLSYNQSNAAYNGVHTGWVGNGTAILVQSGTNGSIQLPTFSSLSALDANNDGVINSSDAGFSSLEVWSDANGNGVMDTGELENLSQAGIASLSLITTTANTNIYGNLISATSALTFVNGTKEAIDLVSFASQGNIALNNQNQQAVSVIMQVANGNEAKAAGVAQGVANTVPAMLTMLATDNANLNAALAVSKPTITLDNVTTELLNGGTFPYAWYQTYAPVQSGINIFDYTAQYEVWHQNVNGVHLDELYSLVTIQAPVDAQNSESAASMALTSVQTAAQQMVTATMDQEQSQNTAFIANTSQAVLGSTQANTAVSAANAAEAAWTIALLDVASASVSLQTAASTLATDQSIVASAMLSEGTISAAHAAATTDMQTPNIIYTVQKGPLRLGQGYATTQDALEAALSFTEQQAAAEGLASAEDFFQTLIAATEQSWSVNSVDLAVSGVSATIAANSLVVAEAGSETLTDGSSPSTYAILPGSSVTIFNFKVGAGGSCLNFLSSGATATFATVTNGIKITVGTNSVTLVGVSSSQLSLTDNFAGIGAIDVSSLTDQSSLQIPSTISDNGFSAIRSIYGVTASDALSLAGKVFNVSVSDTGANIISNISALQILQTAGQLTSVILTDASIPTLSLTANQLTADAAILNKITSAYHVSISGVLVANAAAFAAQANISFVSISDTATDVFANIAVLQTLVAAGKLGLVFLTNTTTPTLALTAAQLASDTLVLGQIMSAYNLSISGVLAANAAALALQANVTSVTISDTAANVVANISALQTLAASGKIGSIILTDTTTPTLALSATQLTADATALGKIASAYNLSISNVLAANAATIAAQAHVTSVIISDTAADVVANISALQTLAASGKIGSIILTDITKPTITLTAAQETADATVLSKITSAYNLLTAGVSAVMASTTATTVSVFDTSANVWTYLSALETQAAAGRIASIAFTDTATPTLVLTAAQLTADSVVLGKITSAYNLSISGVLAANASTVGAQAHVTSVAILDTSTDIVANIVALQTLTAAGKLGSVVLTDTSTPTLALTAAQLTADATALGKITSVYNLLISAVLAANAANVAAQTHVTSITISDTSADVVANLAALQTLAATGKLGSVILTDTSTPTLVLTAAQLAADATVLGKITSAYNLSISGVLAANTATVAEQAHVTSIAISDTSADVVANIVALQTLAATGKLSSVILTDATTPTLALTAAQLTADASALGKITSAYNLSISGVLAANTATVAAQAHVTLVSVSDTAVDIVTNISALQTLATTGKISSIVLTDTTEPTLTLTAAQITADAAALSKITSAYNLLTTGVSAVVASTATAAVSVSDTSANVWAYLSTLESQAAAGRISSIAFTDTAAPTLALTAAQLTTDSIVLGKITNAYNLSISGVLAANASTVGAQAHVTSVAISDTSTDVVANITALQTLAAAGKLGNVVLTDAATPMLALTAAQLTADATALGKITSAYNLSVSNVLAANAVTVAAQAHVNSVVISDTAADVVANISALQTLAAAGEISSIVLTDTTKPTLTLTAAQQTADAAVLNKISSAYNLPSSSVSAAVASTTTVSVAISDTSTNVLTYLSALETQAVAGRISSIAFTDTTAPTLALTSVQLAADTAVLGKITSSYNLSVSGVLTSNAAIVAAQAHVTSVTVSDTTANIVASLSALQTLAAANKLTSIATTDAGVLEVTSSQATSYAAALAKLVNSHEIVITETSAVLDDFYTGTSDVISIGNSTIAVGASMTATINGASDTLTSGASSTVTMTGASDGTTVNGANGVVNLNGTGNWVASSATGTQATANGANAYMSDTGASGNYFIGGTGDQAVVSGTSDGVGIVAGGNNATVSLNGAQQWATIAANNAQVVLNGTNGWVTETAGTGSTLEFYGTGNTAVLSGAGEGVGINTGANNSTADINGNQEWATIAANNAQVVVNGTNSWITETAGTGSTLLFYGTGNTAVLSGSGEGVGIYAGANNSTADLNGTQEWATIAANNAQVIVNGTNGWVTQTAGTGSVLQFYGTGNTAALSGASDGVTISSTATNSVATLAGAGDWVTSAAAGTQITVNGTGAYVTDTGSNGVITVNNTGANVTLGGTNNVVSLSSTGSPVLTISGSGSLTVTGSSAVTATIGNTSQISFAGSNDTINTGISDILSLSGSGNIVVLGGSDTLTDVSGSDVYDVGKNVGVSVINNAVSGGTIASGKVTFLSGITDENLWLKQSGSNLEIDLLGTSSKITLNGWYGSNASAQVQSFAAGGVTLLESQVAQLVSAMAGYAASNSGFNPATATAMPTNTALQNTLAASWH